LFERQQGKSYALNSGIRESFSDVLAFADDDANVDSTWLRNLTSVFADRQWAGAAGRIVLQWPDSLPRWLSIKGPNSRHCFPGLDQGHETKELVGAPFGANMAFRREVFEKYGGFRVDLGPNPDNQIRAEDTEFGRRVISAGEHLCYVPSALVYHPVEPDLINKKHFLKWWYDNGRADAREFQTKRVRELCRIASWTLRWMATLDSRKRFYCKLVVWEKVGRLVESCRLPSDVVRKSREYEPIQKPTADSTTLS
jgi:GT2 family glycosyltransferase